MRVGNVEVIAKGSDLELRVHGCTDNYCLIFKQTCCGPYDALLRQNDVYAAMRRWRKDLQREVLDNLANRELPGVRRGKLARAIAAVRSIYGL